MKVFFAIVGCCLGGLLRVEAQTGLHLPFYDDFTYNSSVSFHTNWQDSIAVNGVTPLNSSGPAKNAYQLDGLNPNGIRYNVLDSVPDIYTKIKTDSLTSNKINASNYTSNTEVLLAFTWKGTGQITPDLAAGDYLVVLAKDANAVWQTVWTSPASFDSSQFYKVEIPLGTSFQSNSLQIKFVRYGSSTALSDSASTIWYVTNIDIRPSLLLPFYDDFTYNSSVSFHTNWQDSIAANGITTLYSGGASKRAYQLDGLSPLGIRYNVLDSVPDIYTKIKTDSLTSNVINASDYASNTGVNLGFAWQGTGKIRPDSAAGDYLVLFAKDENAVWQTLWSSPSLFDSSQFYNVHIPLPSSFLSNSLQIKFVRYGSSTALSDSASTIWYVTKIDISPTLSLAFWEDFSNPATFGTKFKSNTGVYVNNNYAVDEPSAYVATFDGLDDNGKPYNGANPFQYGLGDSLVSLPINLDTLSQSLHPSDSLYFSFYYENSGIGEQPDRIEGDTLVLKMFDNQGDWRSVWQVKLSDTVYKNKFFQVLLKVEDPAFFHKNFKFKFQNYGKLSGAWDIWHVDYIVLDTILNKENEIRQLKDGRVYFSDFAISNKPTSIVAPYFSVPSFHLKKGFSFADSLKYSIRNFSNKENNIQSAYSVSLVNKSGVLAVVDLKDTTAVVDIPKDTVLATGYALNPNDFNSLNNAIPNSGNFELKTKVVLKLVHPNAGNYLFEQNDTVVTSNPFSDYYAYDDGSYERGIEILQKNSGQALKYFSLQPDTLTHIDISFPYDGFNIDGVGMTLVVWADSSNGFPGRKLMSVSSNVLYSKGRNPFTRYQITPTPIDSVFYIGVVQNFGISNALRLGLDLNNDAQKYYYYFSDTHPEWSQYGNVYGAPMMRPVFRGGGASLTDGTVVVTTSQEEPLYVTLKVFPNPTQDGFIHLNVPFDRVDIYDITGYLLITRYSTDVVDLHGLKPGMYFMKTYLNGKRQDAKILYQP
jgi:hypothetical protein